MSVPRLPADTALLVMDYISEHPCITTLLAEAFYEDKVWITFQKSAEYGVDMPAREV